MPATLPDSPERTCLEAIATRKLIRADYNGAELKLAPHLLFDRHGDLYLGAFNPAKARRSDAEPALGYFKLAGLHNLALTDDAFEPLEGVDLTVPRESDTLVFAV
ncbi:hypothetical protein [Novosphingobium sp. B 225]|uniref:hypothetical protein n=1 Tax=Novosphingobium sp. B 225 TaxID=1961849 RepID=UPI000B4BC4A0|nr:hypothetical protein [Novosphingobium sp. B 225]